MECSNFELPNDEGINKCPNAKRFDLEERTSRFSRAIIIYAKKIRETTVTRPLINQLIRAGTSIGANYCEADDTNTRKDFGHKISYCRKEARETKYWLTLLMEEAPEHCQEGKRLWNEARELNLIFAAIYNKLNKKY